MTSTRVLPLNEPTIGDREKRRVLETLDAGFVSSAGPIVEEFEIAFARRLGSAHAIAVSSGTAALHLSFLAAGVCTGDLVAVSDLTFIASANAARYAGADLLLVGPSMRTWNLDTEMLHDEIDRRARAGEPLPAAIEPVHILGSPAEWEPLQAIGEMYGIPVVEDATESLGAEQRLNDTWHTCGTLGLTGCFSFNGNKMITTGGGGMVVTDDGEVADVIRHLSTQAKLPGVGYQHDDVGFNYRMPALSAALGLAQLEQLDAFLADKRRIRALYERLLRELPVALVPVPAWARPAHWLISAQLLDDRVSRDTLVQRLNDQGIGARPMWNPMHRQAPHRGHPVIGRERSSQLGDTAFSLPSSPQLTLEDIERVASALALSLTS